MTNEQDLRRRCLDLRHKCVLLRQIHSQKMERLQVFDAFLNIGTVVVAAFLTFIGFLGTAKLAVAFNLIYPISAQAVEFVFNFVVFLVLLFSILNIAFQFKDQAFRHWRSINLLTDFITDIDHILANSSFSKPEIERHMSFVNSRYKHVIDILPPSTDDDYIRARRMLAHKEEIKHPEPPTSSEK